MVIEPLVQAAAGMIMHPPGYLRGVRELTRKYDVLMIADEVAVGFGRTGKMFACEHEDVAPDLLCLAKGLTGGYLPMAATLATDEIWQAFLGHVRREQDLLSRAHLRRQSAGRGRGLGHARRVRGRADAGAAAGEDRPARRTSCPDRPTAARRRRAPARPDRRRRTGARRGHEGAVSVGGASRACASATTPCSEGVWLRPLGNVIVIMPPLAITLEQLDRIAGAVEKGIAAVCD